MDKTSTFAAPVLRSNLPLQKVAIEPLCHPHWLLLALCSTLAIFCALAIAPMSNSASARIPNEMQVICPVLVLRCGIDVSHLGSRNTCGGGKDGLEWSLSPTRPPLIIDGTLRFWQATLKHNLGVLDLKDTEIFGASSFVCFC